MTKIVKYNQIVMVIVAMAFFSALAVAQTTEEAPQKIEKIEVKGMREPAIMPYKEAYKMLTSLQASAHDKVAIRVRVFSSNKTVKLSDIKINLVGDRNSQPIAISEDGLIEVPLSQALLDDNAEFITNQKKGSMGGTVNIDIVPPTNGPLRYRYLAEALDQARDAVKGFVPWYMRWLVPNNWNAVDIEFATNAAETATVKSVKGKQVFRAGDNHTISILLEDFLINENPEVVFSSPPKRIGAGLINEMLSYTAQKPE